MKKYILEFIRRGIMACWLGPVVLSIIYLTVQHKTGVETVTVNQVCLGMLSLTGLAFVAGGMNVVYQIERLPLMAAVSIHGVALYISYLTTYLVNGWLKDGLTHLLAFTGIFVVGYLAIWAVIYIVNKRSTAKLNEGLKKIQRQ